MDSNSGLGTNLAQPGPSVPMTHKRGKNAVTTGNSFSPLIAQQCSFLLVMFSPSMLKHSASAPTTSIMLVPHGDFRAGHPLSAT